MGKFHNAAIANLLRLFNQYRDLGIMVKIYIWLKPTVDDGQIQFKAVAGSYFTLPARPCGRIFNDYEEALRVTPNGMASSLP